VQEVELVNSLAGAVAACAEAVHALPKTSVAETNSNTQTIRATRGWTWRSWGDEIQIDVRGTESGASIIRISSRPRLRTTLVDWGSNLRNVTTIRDLLVGKGARPISAEQHT
ncbi:MAG: hypothetical protein ACRD3M_19285, partial [Thermoanaerobaculia bacterium]